MTLAAIAFAAILCLYQIAWLDDHSPVKVWEKSRRIGASWVEALYSVLQAAKRKSEGGQNTYYLSYNKDMTQQFIKDCAWWAKVLRAVCANCVCTFRRASSWSAARMPVRWPCTRSPRLAQS